MKKVIYVFGIKSFIPIKSYILATSLTTFGYLSNLRYLLAETLWARKPSLQ